MVALVIVVIDEAINVRLEVARQVVVVEQDAVLEHRSPQLCGVKLCFSDRIVHRRECPDRSGLLIIVVGSFEDDWVCYRRVRS